DPLAASMHLSLNSTHPAGPMSFSKSSVNFQEKRASDRRPRLPRPMALTRVTESCRKFARIMGFPYYGYVNVTLSIDDDLVKKVRKIAVERDTTLTGMVREYLEKLAADEAATGRKRRERETLERSFEQFRFRVGERTWKRADLYVRS